MKILTLQPTVQVDSEPIQQLIQQIVDERIESLNKRNEELEKRIKELETEVKNG